MSEVMNQAIRGRPPDERQQRTEAIRHAAAAAGFADPSDAARMLSTVDGDTEKLVSELADAKPYLLHPNGTMNRLIRAPRLPQPEEPSTEPEPPRNWGSADGGNSGGVVQPEPDMNRQLRRHFSIQRHGYDPDPDY